MLNFKDFNKKIHKGEYEIVKSRSGLPMFVINNPLIQDDDEDERELVGREVTTTVIDFDVEDENDEPVKIRTIPQQVQRVCDYITRHF
ncbi:MAG: hypothetical protein H8D80_02385 [Proteobacteria bacterium]|nr:hypothetical protein [Pseudomonadota bacterium]